MLGPTTVAGLVHQDTARPCEAGCDAATDLRLSYGDPEMIEALWWGFFASSSLVLGGALALRFSIPSRVLGLVMAFGSGVLISAVAYDLVEDASTHE